MFWSFFTGIILFIAYSGDFKASAFYIPAGLAIAIGTNLLWLYMIKGSNDQSEIMTRSFTWDGMRMLIYAVAPIMFMGAPITLNKVAACLLIGLGMILLNFG